MKGRVGSRAGGKTCLGLELLDIGQFNCAGGRRRDPEGPVGLDGYFIAVFEESPSADAIAFANEEVVDVSAIAGLAVPNVNHGLSILIKLDGVKFQMVARNGEV